MRTWVIRHGSRWVVNRHEYDVSHAPGRETVVADFPTREAAVAFQERMRSAFQRLAG